MISGSNLVSPDNEERFAANNRIWGGGAMADATRAHHWASTPLGPTESWSETLVATVNSLLSSPLPTILFWGEEMTQIYNDAFVPLLSQDRHHGALGRTGRVFWHDTWPLVGHQLEAALYRGEATTRSTLLIPIYRHGVLEDVWWNYSYFPIYLPDGSIGGVLDICQDVTSVVVADRERDRALAALRAERGRLLDVFQQAPIFFALLEGPNHVYSITNSLYDSLIGGREVIGRSVAEAIPEILSQGYIETLDTVLRSGEPYIANGETVELVQIAGQPARPRILDFVYQPLREPDGSASGIIVLGVDVTERKQAERALIQNEKLAAVGRLAASIAHDINNPLEAVTNLLFLANSSGNTDQIHEYLAMADAELRRAAAITSQTLRFHRQSTDPVPARVQDLVVSAIALFQGRILNGHIKLLTRLEAAQPVMCFDGEIRQMVGNLLSNALDALKPRGRLYLRTREATDWSTGRRGLALTVGDTGCGMSPEIMNRVFEAFFTTKGIGGTGLGLWISADIVRRHHGSLRVRSSDGQGGHGTVFRVFLPYGTRPERSATTL